MQMVGFVVILDRQDLLALLEHLALQEMPELLDSLEHLVC